jgi:hypothetical protein
VAEVGYDIFVGSLGVDRGLVERGPGSGAGRPRRGGARCCARGAPGRLRLIRGRAVSVARRRTDPHVGMEGHRRPLDGEHGPVVGPWGGMVARKRGKFSRRRSVPTTKVRAAPGSTNPGRLFHFTGASSGGTNQPSSRRRRPSRPRLTWPHPTIVTEAMEKIETKANTPANSSSSRKLATTVTMPRRLRRASRYCHAALKIDTSRARRATPKDRDDTPLLDHGQPTVTAPGSHTSRTALASRRTYAERGWGRRSVCGRERRPSRNGARRALPRRPPTASRARCPRSGLVAAALAHGLPAKLVLDLGRCGPSERTLTFATAERVKTSVHRIRERRGLP